ncbi:cytochrome b/b6 domain-containing protein [Litoreibacter arenae]|uniref:Cytochrome b561 n=1 Tax=Litoreibacter arenae DSM 19593 TaxID=1123360 RepID=S9QK75_9RHOB|nr:cytochrome b/b6 domain-containing protein [Litoreibacter arenae]EPX80172.1 Cytochrome b561 [Litoreibacter arenae DSM 19593]
MRGNSTTTYGSVTKSFHWLIALLIITMIPLGIYANGLPYDTGEALAFKAQMFSIHKTLGVFIFFTALARIAWAISQPKPALLNADKRLEAMLAELIHWTLYAALVLVPLTGWIHHAATTGFAPIWWPFGQGLPFVPKDDAFAHIFASLHIIFERVLVISILLHVAGALKHHFIDRDITLKRMLPGTTEPDSVPEQHRSALPIIGAVGAYMLALVVGASLGLFAATEQDSVPRLAAVESGWTVQDGTLAITVRQLGSDVEGSFADWTAAINFAEEPDANGVHGDVEVQVAIGSLSLGSVTAQAMGPDFLNAEAHDTAVFKADILEDGPTYTANGTLTLKGMEVPVNLPFSLQIDGDTAVMQGQTRLNRTSFNIGETYPDESSVGFDVAVTVNLTATRN